MTWIDLTNVTANNSIAGLLTQINVTIGHGWFFTFVLLALFVILMVTWLNYSPQDAFFAASLITTMLAGFFLVMNWIGSYTFAVCATITFIALIVSYLTKG